MGNRKWASEVKPMKQDVIEFLNNAIPGSNRTSYQMPNSPNKERSDQVTEVTFIPPCFIKGRNYGLKNKFQNRFVFMITPHGPKECTMNTQYAILLFLILDIVIFFILTFLYF